MVTIGPHLLGRLVEHDPASKNYPAPVRRIAKPINRLWTNNAPILDQAKLGSCVGNTVAEWLNCAVAHNNRMRGTMAGRTNKRSYLKEPQAVDLYSLATQRDEDDSVAYPPVDCGTSGLGAAKALKDLGFIDGYDWTFSFDAFLAALQLSPVCVGINWYSGMFDPDKKGFVEPTGTLDGGHELLGRGINVTNEWVLFRNHWTKDWGLGGECKMRFPVIERLLGEQGDVMVPRLIH